MKAILIVVFFMLMPCMGFAQTDLSPINKSISKGRMYFYWGYNRGWFTNSDIHFKGSNYDFTLKDVVAKDRQSKLAADPYLKLNKLTIPQYNLRIGYYLTENWDISFGIDHMKYVMQQDQTVEINGYIHNTSSNYNADYSNNDIQLTGDFFEI